MENENNHIPSRRGKEDDEKIKNRLNELYSSRDSLPSSLSIPQAEELKKRIQNLEMQLENKLAAQVPSTPDVKQPTAPTPTIEDPTTAESLVEEAFAETPQGAEEPDLTALTIEEHEAVAVYGDDSFLEFEPTTVFMTEPPTTALPEKNAAEEVAIAPIPVRVSRPMTPVTIPEAKPTRYPRLAALWAKLTVAHESITETGERQQAQLAAGVSIGLTILMIVGLVSTVIAQGNFGITAIFLSIFSLLILVSYFINRSKYHRWGALLLVVGLALAGYGLAISNPTRVSSSLYSVLQLSLVLGSLFLPLWGLGTLTGGLFVATAFILPWIIPAYTTGIIDGGYNLALGALLIIAVAYRNSVERSRVAEVTTANRELQDMQTTLELRVQDRTHDLELAGEVGRAIAERVANPQEMMTSAAELIRARFNLYYTQVYLTDPTDRILVLRAGTGDVGKELLARNHRLAMNQNSLNGRAASERKPIIVADTTHSPTFLPNPLLPKTRSEMAIPLMTGGRVIGVLDMQSEVPGSLNETNLPAFEALAGQLSVAIQNALLFDQAEEARRQIETNAARVTTAGWQDFLNTIERSARLGYLYNQNETLQVHELAETNGDSALVRPISVTGAEIGRIQLADENREWSEQEKQILESTAAQLGQHIESLRLLAQAERYRTEAEQAVRRLTREGWEDYMKTRRHLLPGYFFDSNEVKPLNLPGTDKLKEGLSQALLVRDELIGELAVDVETQNEEAQVLLHAVANQLSSHIENLRLAEQNERRAREMETVAQLSATTSTLLDPDELLQTIVDNTRERFGVYHAHIYLVNETWQTLILAAGAGAVGRSMVAKEHTIPVNTQRSLVARAVRDRKAVIVENVRADPYFLPNPALPETRAEMAVPMIVGDQVLGVFDVQSVDVNGFSDEDASIYTTLASQVAVALQNARLYREQAATVTQLRELDRLKSSFLANMSHELRTPLNSILGFSDVMLEELDGPLTENMVNDLQLIQKNGQHLLHLINDVLDMAKIEAGRMNLALERFNVQEVLKEVLNITSTLSGEKNLEVALEEDSDSDVEIHADRTRVQQVMINLVNNAIKFTDEGNIAIRVARQENQKVRVTIKDTGIGIPPDQLESIFQEFSQVDTSTTRKSGGTGLGLPISRKLVEMHGGLVWAESTGVAGEGSTFFVELPLEAKISETSEVESQ